MALSASLWDISPKARSLLTLNSGPDMLKQKTNRTVTLALRHWEFHMRTTFSPILQCRSQTAPVRKAKVNKDVLRLKSTCQKKNVLSHARVEGGSNSRFPHSLLYLALPPSELYLKPDHKQALTHAAAQKLQLSQKNRFCDDHVFMILCWCVIDFRTLYINKTSRRTQKYALKITARLCSSCLLRAKKL